MAENLSMDTVFMVYKETGIVVETFEDAVTALKEIQITLEERVKLLSQELNTLKMKVVHKEGEEIQEQSPKRIPMHKDPVFMANLRKKILDDHNSKFLIK